MWTPSRYATESPSRDGVRLEDQLVALPSKRRRAFDAARDSRAESLRISLAGARCRSPSSTMRALVLATFSKSFSVARSSSSCGPSSASRTPLARSSSQPMRRGARVARRIMLPERFSSSGAARTKRSCEPPFANGRKRAWRRAARAFQSVACPMSATPSSAPFVARKAIKVAAIGRAVEAVVDDKARHDLKRSTQGSKISSVRNETSRRRWRQTR